MLRPCNRLSVQILMEVKTTGSLPVSYRTNKNAWMTAEIFTDWIRIQPLNVQEEKKLFFSWIIAAPSRRSQHIVSTMCGWNSCHQTPHLWLSRVIKELSGMWINKQRSSRASSSNGLLRANEVVKCILDTGHHLTSHPTDIQNRLCKKYKHISYLTNINCTWAKLLYFVVKITFLQTL